MHGIYICERRALPLPCSLEGFRILYHPCTSRSASTANLDLLTPFCEKILQCFSLFVAKIIPKRNCIKLLVHYQTNGDLTSFLVFVLLSFVFEKWVHFAFMRTCTWRWISGASWKHSINSKTLFSLIIPNGVSSSWASNTFLQNLS